MPLLSSRASIKSEDWNINKKGRLLTFLLQFPQVKRFLSSVLNWYRQTLGQSPRYWLRLPTELARFTISLQRYRASMSNKHEEIKIHPIFLQHTKASFDTHYTYQSAWASRRLVKNCPSLHVDVSSDLRFVTQLSAFFPVTYLEFRPPHITLPGLTVLHASITNLPFADQIIDSLSCLHVIEHIGLGRYGDPINPDGYLLALRELERVLSVNGRLYISAPIGNAITMFNAHRIFDPSHLPFLLPNLILEEFSVVTTDRRFEEHVPFANYAREEYACGLYVFRRPEKKKE